MILLSVSCGCQSGCGRGGCLCRCRAIALTRAPVLRGHSDYTAQWPMWPSAASQQGAARRRGAGAKYYLSTCSYSIVRGRSNETMFS
eukprot:3157867-Pleurochrysis_carterae.AAC.1